MFYLKLIIVAPKTCMTSSRDAVGVSVHLIFWENVMRGGLLFLFLVAAILLNPARADDVVFEPVSPHSTDSMSDSTPAREISAISLASQGLRANAKAGQKIRTVGGMACFKFGEGDYRCAKRNSVNGRVAVIAAPDVDGAEKQILDTICFTVARGWSDQRCGFNATFVITRRGIDQSEMATYYIADKLYLSRWSKY